MVDVGPYRWQNIPTIFRTQSSRASRLFCLVCAQPYHAVPNSCHRYTLGQPLRMVLGHSVTVRQIVAQILANVVSGHFVDCTIPGTQTECVEDCRI